MESHKIIMIVRTYISKFHYFFFGLNFITKTIFFVWNANKTERRRRRRRAWGDFENIFQNSFHSHSRSFSARLLCEFLSVLDKRKWKDLGGDVFLLFSRYRQVWEVSQSQPEWKKNIPKNSESLNGWVWKLKFHSWTAEFCATGLALNFLLSFFLLPFGRFFFEN